MSTADVEPGTPVALTDVDGQPAAASRWIEVDADSCVYRGSGSEQADASAPVCRRVGRGARWLAAVVMSIVLGQGAVLLAPGTADAQNPPDAHRPATWNMQVSASRWAAVYNLSQLHSAVALQEVPSRPPAGARATGRRVGAAVEYRWQQGRRGPLRYLYILPQRSRNLGMVTSFRASRFFELGGVYRSLLAVYDRDTNLMFASAHASANGGGDAASLVTRARNRATANGWDWAVLGDFNRDPQRLARPPGTYLYNAGQATQQSGGELDYMVSNVGTDNWQATVGVNQGSDHWPVYFGSLRAAAGQRVRIVTIHSASNGGVLDVLGDAGGANNDGETVGVYHYHDSQNQLWSVQRQLYVAGRVLYRILSQISGIGGPFDKCLDVDNGQQSHAGDYLNIWTCHQPNGQPTPGGPTRDTQNFTLEHPDRYQPNLTMIRNNATNQYANVLGDAQGDARPVGQWPYQRGARNEYFYFHPDEGSF
jgi:cytolethal distending toxin subunit B